MDFTVNVTVGIRDFVDDGFSTPTKAESSRQLVGGTIALGKILAAIILQLKLVSR